MPILRSCLPRSNSVRRLTFQIFEGSHRLGDEPLGGVADLTVAEGHRARAVKGMARRYETRPRVGGLQEADFHLHRHAAARSGVEGTAGDRHDHVEQGYEYAPVSDGPAVQMTRGKVECDDRSAVVGADEFDA